MDLNPKQQTILWHCAGRAVLYWLSPVFRGGGDTGMMITDEELRKVAYKLYLTQGGRCALTGLPLPLPPTTMSNEPLGMKISKLDHNKLWTLDNIGWIYTVPPAQHVSRLQKRIDAAIHLLILNNYTVHDRSGDLIGRVETAPASVSGGASPTAGASLDEET